MNGNSPAAQDYGQALDWHVDRALRNSPEDPRAFFEWALDTVAEGGGSVPDLLIEFTEKLTCRDEFETGIARRVGMA